MLEKYENDHRISYICGTNIDGITNSVSEDYFFTRGASISGFAVWKRSYKFFGNYSYYKNKQHLRNIKKSAHKHKIFKRKLELYPNGVNYKNQWPYEEFWVRFNFHADFSLCIVPKFNLINNIGFGDNSTNVRELWIYPKAIRNLFNTKTYEMKFPLNHPIYFTENIEYEDRVINSLRHRNPIVRYKRYLEKIIKYFILRFFQILK